MESQTGERQKSHGEPHGVVVKGVVEREVYGVGLIGPASSLKDLHGGPVGSPCGSSRARGSLYGHEPLETRRFSWTLSFLSTAPTGAVHAGSVEMGHASVSPMLGPVSQRKGRTLYMLASASLEISSATAFT